MSIFIRYYINEVINCTIRVSRKLPNNIIYKYEKGGNETA